jgi:hypothetical protein
MRPEIHEFDCKGGTEVRSGEGQKGFLVLAKAHEHSTRLAQETSSSADDRIDRQRLIDALANLHRLLEEYAPSWYTQEHHEKAALALHSAEKV